MLGGGGLWGIAWMTGLFAGLSEQGLDVRLADKVIGTSAGSVVGSQILSEVTFEELLQRQVDPALQAHEVSIPAHVAAAAEAATAILDEIIEPQERLRQLGCFAQNALTASQADHRRDVVRTRLVSEAWPKTPLLITAVDVLSGETSVFDRNSGAHLVDAVAASCAVPKIWPPVTIGSRSYMDGGIRSLANAHLASDARRVLVVSPYSRDARPFLGPSLRGEVETLRARGVHVVVIEADAEAIRVAGATTLEPSVRPAATKAGLTQARNEADRLRVALG